MTRMITKRAYKYRFYPTSEQEDLLLRTFGCVRVVWNQILDWRQRQWVKNKVSVNYGKASEHLTSLKRDANYIWLNEVSSVPLQQALRHQQKAMVNFFEKRASYPRFKSRKTKQSATFTGNGFTYKNGEIKLAKTDDPLNIVWSRPLPEGAEPSSVTVSLDRAGRYHISILVEEEIDHLPLSTKTIGLDLGVEDFAVTSDGEKIQAPRIGRKHHKKVAKLQKSLSRKEKGSKNREKARLKLAKAQAKIADSRRDFLHKLSTRLVRENQTIILEDLAVKNMAAKGGSRKRGLNRSILDTGMAEFRSMLAYKAEWYGRNVEVIPRFHPSTQLCSDCGATTGPKGVNGLGTREWACIECGSIHDRDINAAKNVLAAGTAVSVCGDGRRLRHQDHLVSEQPSMKQKLLVSDLRIPAPCGRG